MASTLPFGDFFDVQLITREDLRFAYAERRFQSTGLFKGVVHIVVWAPVDEGIHVSSARKAAMKRKRGSKPTVLVTDEAAYWKRLKDMPDSAVHYTKDSPRTTAADWADAIAHRGLPELFRKLPIAIRVDEDVLEWFKAQGPGYQTRMNAVLREYRNAHRALEESRPARRKK
ncbi:MAG TPA: BrnA antitoxin family protein [Steroidobacteraceae bacterium]|jgi:uncharacterized protein (DUF4415 family)